jgi:hypothetical protein
MSIFEIEIDGGRSTLFESDIEIDKRINFTVTLRLKPSREPTDHR